MSELEPPLPPAKSLSESVTAAVEGPVVDPTDAPELRRSVANDASRWELVVVVAQALLAVAAIVVAVLAPDRVGNLVVRFASAAVLVVVIAAIATEIESHERSRRRLAAAALVGVGSLLLVIDPGRFVVWTGRVGGIALAGFGLYNISAAIRSDGSNRRRSGRNGLAFVAIGLVMVFAFEPLAQLIAIVAVVLIAATAALRAGTQSGFVSLATDASDGRPLLIRWVDAKGKTPQRREDIYEQVFFEGPNAAARTGRFMLMMLFASVISAAGVLADSTAVVIGAMLVAPLISPMMGMGLSLATGWPNRLGRSALLVLGGIVVAVGTGWLLASTRVTVDLLSNSQIVSRSSPRLVDLVIAVAAGSAGAYAISRKDASSSLPGVAVAIALVPPLSVVGITAEGGDWEQASGTLLLFLTNLVAIIVAGGVVFVLTGVVPMKRFAENQHRVRTAFVGVGVLALLVVGGLTINGRQIAADSFDQDEAAEVVAEWLGDESDFAVVSVDVDDGLVAVLLAGPGEPPQAQRLADDLGERLDATIRLDLQWIPRNRILVTSGD